MHTTMTQHETFRIFSLGTNIYFLTLEKLFTSRWTVVVVQSVDCRIQRWRRKHQIVLYFSSQSIKSDAPEGPPREERLAALPLKPKGKVRCEALSCHLRLRWFITWNMFLFIILINVCTNLYHFDALDTFRQLILSSLRAKFIFSNFASAGSTQISRSPARLDMTS